ALRARRLLRRQLAGGNPVGPIAHHPQRALGAHALEAIDHVVARLPGLDAPRPGLVAGIELTETRRNGPGRLVADLMAAHAAVGANRVEKLGLAFHGRIDA